MPRRVKELLVSWGGHVECSNILEVWRLASLCLMWCIWRQRITRSFEDIETSVVVLKRIMFNALYTWISAHHSLLFF
jgi:hypothetical protein